MLPIQDWFHLIQWLFQVVPRVKNLGNNRASRISFDFTEIFDELSALSRDISKHLEDDDDFKDQAEDGNKAPVQSKKDLSLRQLAFRNNAKVKDRLQPSIQELADGVQSETVGKPERLRNIKSLDAKLAAIRDELQGSAYWTFVIII